MRTTRARSPFLLAPAVAALVATSVSACGDQREPFEISLYATSVDAGDAGTAPGPTGTFTSGGDAGGAASAFAGCATETRKAEVLPVDMVIGLDTSFSMDFYDKWTSVRAALEAFAANPAYSDLGLGLQFFPIRKQCNVDEYANLAVPITLLPGAAVPIDEALGGQQMSGGTPIVQLLEGLVKQFGPWTTAHPKRKPVILLATDGIPDDTCLGSDPPNTIDQAVAVATAAQSADPKITTFVFGVESPGIPLTALDAIAQAGGTGSAILVDTNQDVEKAFAGALDKVRRESIPCDYDIPSLGEPVDATKVNVQYTPMSGAPQVFVYVGGADRCALAPDTGWYFDDAASPKKVILCGGSCDKVKNDDQGRVDVVFGCDRVEVK